MLSLFVLGVSSGCGNSGDSDAGDSGSTVAPDGGLGSGADSGGPSTTDAGAEGGTSNGDSGKDGGGQGTASCPSSKVLLATPTEVNSLTYAPPPGVLGVQLGDLNKDGNLDMVIAGVEGATVSLGNGDGTFGTPVLVSGGVTNVTVAIGDLDGDSWPDLVAITAQQGNSGIFYAANNADGKGTFAAFKSLAGFADNVSFGILADLNGDGLLDVVASGPVLSVFINSGKATLPASPVTYSGSAWETVYGDTGNSAGNVVPSDVDGDGLPDLVFASGAGSSLDNSDGGLCVSLNKNHGAMFADPVCTAPTEAARDAFTVAMGDFNGDGAADAVLGINGELVEVLLSSGKGTGTFKAPVDYPTAGAMDYVVTGDFNNDGALDVAGLDPNGGITVLAGKGDGTFSAAGSYAAGAGGSTTAINAAVLGKNGLTSIVVMDTKVTSSAANGGAQVLLGTCSN